MGKEMGWTAGGEMSQVGRKGCLACHLHPAHVGSGAVLGLLHQPLAPEYESVTTNATMRSGLSQRLPAGGSSCTLGFHQRGFH